MADEQYRWLNRETAERLLNGESPEAVGPADRDQAERLSSALGALSAPPPPAGGELPGEAAALAAFRKVREERTGRAAGAVSAVPVAPRAGAAQGTDVGLVRIGAPSADRSGTGRAPRWARPVRFGLAAALTVGMVGGAAVLAGIGVLPTPSGVSGPAATATATATGPPERPLPPHPSEKDAPGGVAPGEEQGEPSGDADGDTGRQDGPGTGADEDGGLAETGVKTGGLGAGNGRGKQIASACRALRDGRKLPGNRRRLLEGAAGGSAQVGPYCENVLAHHGTGADTGTGSGPDSGPTTKRDGDDDTGNGRSDNGNGNGNGNGSNEGAANGNAGDGGSANGNGSNGNGSNGNAGNGNAGNGKGNANGNKGNSGQGNGQGNGQGGRGNGGKHGKGADTSG
ncbi:hypothetical protein ACFYRD_18690 [Streptomyces hirsutus]|uniref:hypothetical protein n=1 Tax=Streptomyces hirsutus TaxID=35620 RepID=UPI00367D1BBD